MTKSWLSVAMSGVLIIASSGCGRFSPPATMNMFEGMYAHEAVAKIKAKLGASEVNVCRVDIYHDRVRVVVRDPERRKNFEEYTYQSGAIIGPKPADDYAFGKGNFTNPGKGRVFKLSELNLLQVSQVCSRAGARAQIEDGKCDVISIAWEPGRRTRSKEENDKKDAEQRAHPPMIHDLPKTLADVFTDVVLTWHVWIKGPHATKDFWIDPNGTIWDSQ